jgi:hypothetical protein
VSKLAPTNEPTASVTPHRVRTTTNDRFAANGSSYAKYGSRDLARKVQTF